MGPLRDLFLLDPDVVFLNHGSFGACPRPVFEEYQRLQRELERQPVEFLGRERRFPDLMGHARERLAAYVGADPADLVLLPNASAGINLVARSLDLRPGDEVLATDQEYGGMQILWRFVCERAGATFVTRPPDELFDALGRRTRVLFVSQITSPTAVRLPVAELVAAAGEAGVFSLVDGAHGPGQVPLHLDALGADAYAGNCHKWLCAPKGAGFLHLRPEHQGWLEPSVVSWDWTDDAAFAVRHQWVGTQDPAALLAVPAAIDFQDAHDWDAARARCRALAREARRRLADLFGLEPLAPEDAIEQMAAAPLPPCDPEEVKRRLYEEHRVEVPVWDWGGRPLVRVSFQGYNDEADLDALLAALEAVLDSRHRIGHS
jgi:isopenicillin-N epimerase